MAQVSSRARIILVAYATWLRSRFGHTTFRFSFMFGSSFEPYFESLVACATWLRSKVRFHEEPEVERHSGGL